MAQIQLLIELRCVHCDSVLIVNGIHTDKHGCFACIEPCEECSKLTKRVPDRAKSAVKKSSSAAKRSSNGRGR